jgi:hypothetical protein
MPPSSGLTAALASPTSKVDLTAVSLAAVREVNLDFSIFKVEAPPLEFQSIGSQLSERRRNDAEIGTPHRTARILGALFEDAIPSTPELVKAYGIRVSEILELANNKDHDPSQYGMFKGFTGADGTSIWAAATSGRSALHIQLLTCMLARFWEATEATSVWTELIKERKKEILARYKGEESLPLETVAVAALFDISRPQLAEWDASARAWLRTADTVKRREQTQLKLIVDNIIAPVSADMKVYSSVMSAWKTAVNSMEATLSGAPQSLQNGALLLGLSAWHLYPDLLVLGKHVTKLSLKDPLIPDGATITIGLQRANDRDPRGITWCLSLAHLRYYGRPVKTERAFNLNTSRLSFEELSQVALGSLSGRWECPGDATRSYTDWFLALYDALVRDGERQDAGETVVTTQRKASQVFMTSSTNWLRILIDAAVAVLNLTNDEKATFSRLHGLGHRHGRQFFGSITADGEELFGLFNPSIILPLMKGPEERITYLRHIAKKPEFRDSVAYIRYRKQHAYEDVPGFEYASARPRISERTAERDMNVPSDSKDPSPQTLVHYRWVNYAPTQGPQSSSITSSAVARKRKFPFASDTDDSRQVQTSPGPCPTMQPGIEERFRLQDGQFVSDFERVMHFSIQHATTTRSQSPTETKEPAVFECRFGDPDVAALFVRIRASLPTQAWYDKHLSDKQTRCLHNFDDLKWALEADLLDVNSLLAYLESKFPVKYPDLCNSLRAFASARDVYKLLPGATTAIDVIRRSIQKKLWASTAAKTEASSPPLSSLQPFALSRPATFACVTYFESGHCDIQPQDLVNVMAMSSGDSIFVAGQLLCDPIEEPHPNELKRIAGNVGRAGVTMLIPPKMPMIQDVELEHWDIINHAKFDGRAENNFEGTTLHLSFTEYDVPVGIGNHGGQDSEVSLLETVISVQHGEKWIGDIDPLSAFGSKLLKRIAPPANTCQHELPNKPENTFVAIDNWAEFIDTLRTREVVRAQKNWTARLAAASISAMRGEAGKFLTVVCPEKMCWRCCFRDLEDAEGYGSPSSPMMFIW